MNISLSAFIYHIINSAIEPYTRRAYSLEDKQCYNNIAIDKEKYSIYILQLVRRDILLRVCGGGCVCVFFPFILDIKFVGRTSRGRTGGRSHRISHSPSFCGAYLNFSREKEIQPFLSLVDREVEFSEKNPVYRDRTHAPTCQKVTRLLLSYRGNQKSCSKKNQNAPRPSEHPPVRGENMSKRLGGIKGCKYKTS